MSTPVRVMVWIGIGVLTLPWLYVAARVVTRGVLRSISNHRRK